MAAFVYFWSSAYEVSGCCGTDTLYPSFLRMLATSSQPEPSAKAPCTKTTFLIGCFKVILLFSFDFVPEAPNTIVNVGTGRVPADYLSLLVSERLVLSKEPTILTVLAERPVFHFEGDSARESNLALVTQSFKIVWVK